DVGVGNHANARRRRLDASPFQGLDHAFIGGSRSQDFPVLAIVNGLILAVRFDDDIHQIVRFGGGLGDDDVAFFVEHIRDGTGRSHVAAVFPEDVTNLADGAVAIVGIDVQQNGDATGTVALQCEFFVGGAGEFAGTPLDGPLDVVGRHVFGLGCQNGTAQAR